MILCDIKTRVVYTKLNIKFGSVPKVIPSLLHSFRFVHLFAGFQITQNVIYVSCIALLVLCTIIIKN